MYSHGQEGGVQGVLRKEKYIVHAVCAGTNLTMLFLKLKEKAFCLSDSRLMS